ncbi:MAG: chemotaxis protein CheX [Leptospiraceae bacterium]|nr:MAG: chemotaxis protein CheX [Leptospiraceae bacterium]
MDPLLDEKIIITFSQIIPEYFYETYQLIFKREAFGPSLNEGICYEFVSSIDFSGDISGKLFLCMDGATKLKILPYLSKNHHIDTYQKGMANSILMEIMNQIASMFSEEFSYAKISIKIHPPEIFNNTLYKVNFEIYRQYMLIFNVFYESNLIGRVYFIILLEK